MKPIFEKYSVLTVLFLLEVSCLCAADNPAVIPTNRDGNRHKSIVARMEQGNVDLLMVGDSITHNWEGPGQEVWNEYYGKRKALNFGIGGDQTQHVLWRLEHSPLEKISPKLAVVMIGTNNIGRPDRCSPEQTLEGIVKIIDVMKIRLPKTKILLLEIFPRDEKPDSERRVKINIINEGLRKIYQNDQVPNVTLYSIGTFFLDKDEVLSKDIMPDFLHPNENGYRIWANAIEAIVAEAVDPLPREAIGVSKPDKWWIDRFNEKNEILKKGNVDILAIGDSITHFWENRGQEYWKQYFSDLNIINLGISGDRTENVIWRLEHYDFSKVDPRLAILLIGVNNAAHSDAPKDIALGKRKICEILHAKFPKMKIIVLHIFPWGGKNEPQKQERVNAVNNLLPFYLRDLFYVTKMDIGHLFIDKQGNIPNKLMPDYCHPNAEGYNRWGKALNDIIRTELAP